MVDDLETANKKYALELLVLAQVSLRHITLMGNIHVSQ